MTMPTNTQRSRPNWGTSFNFTAALLLGAWAILTEAPFWISAAAVAAFGAVLWARGSSNQDESYWMGSAGDAPYFLGFLLTLVALYHALSISAETAGASQPDPGVLLRAAGAALLPTGVGLFFRQILTTYADTASGDAAGRSDQTLANIAAALSELIEITRQSLYRDEVMLEKAMSRLATELERIRADAIIGDIQRVHQEMISVLGEFVSKRKEYALLEETTTTAFFRSIQKVEGNINELAESVSMSATEVKKASDRISESLGSVAIPLSSAGERATTAFDAVEGSIGAFNKALLNQNENIKKSSALMTEVASKARLLVADLEQSRTALSKVNIDMEKVPASLVDTASEIDKAAKHLAHSVQTVVSPLHKEVHEIDALVGDLTTILTRRINELEAV
jgi:methyl-accepting chemotaxis protein